MLSSDLYKSFEIMISAKILIYFCVLHSRGIIHFDCGFNEYLFAIDSYH